MPKPLAPTHQVVVFDAAVGICFPDGSIWISTRQEDDEQFSTMLHEWLHRFFPRLSEKKVRKLESDFMQAARKHFTIKRRRRLAHRK